MKLPGLVFKGGTRRAWVLLAGIGTAGALTLAPLAVGVGQAGATTPTPVTTTTTVVTKGTWTSTTGKVLVECPYSNYTTITGASWIWATLGQKSCTSGIPVTVPGGTVTLTKSFTIPGIPQGATLTLAADNGARVSVNGVVVASVGPSTTTSNFTTTHPTIIAPTAFHQGTNTITIIGTNETSSGYNPAGVIAKLTVSSTSTTTNLCKHTGWRDWTSTPGPFQNQGDCVSYFVKNPNGNDPTIPNTAQS